MRGVDHLAGDRRCAGGTGAGRENTALPTFVEARNQFELNYLRKLLQITKGNVTHAARMAGRNRTEFYKLLSRHELDANDFKE